MLLVVDSGNTNIVFALYDGASQIGVWRRANDYRWTSDQYGVWLTQLMDISGRDLESVDGAVVATVVPDTLFSLKSLCREFLKVEPLVVGDPDVDIGIGALVDSPESVGADRLVNAVAAHERYGKALIVVDFGTATTFDVVDGDGNYTGGCIAPGIQLSVETLHDAAALLPRISVERPPAVIGKSTARAMQSGIYWGYIGLIEGLVGKIREETAAELPVIATGGLAPLFADGTEVIDVVDQDMTLRGLVSIFRRNSGS